MRVLVTRPLPDAETTAADLRHRDHEAVLAPMLRIDFVEWEQHARPSPVEFDAIVATSPNGVRGLVGHPDIDRLRRTTLFVVGDGSARLAESFGFTDIRPAKDDVTDVIARIQADLTPGSALLYAAGRDRSGDLKGDLAGRGYTVDLVEVYQAVTAPDLPDPAIKKLTAGEIDRILIFSARTAKALITALSKADLLAVSRRIPIHAISQQAAEPLISAGFRSIVVALRPDAAELLDTLESR